MNLAGTWDQHRHTRPIVGVVLTQDLDQITFLVPYCDQDVGTHYRDAVESLGMQAEQPRLVDLRAATVAHLSAKDLRELAAAPDRL